MSAMERRIAHAESAVSHASLAAVSISDGDVVVAIKHVAASITYSVLSYLLLKDARSEHAADAEVFAPKANIEEPWTKTVNLPN